MMIEKAQGRADREGVQPQRSFGKFYRHRVFVDAEDALLEDHATHDVAVVELRIGD